MEKSRLINEKALVPRDHFDHWLEQSEAMQSSTSTIASAEAISPLYDTRSRYCDSEP